MEEQEVVKHTKKVYKILNSKEHSFWHKFKEFLIEIFIIVFAVSLSIWLHDKSEHTHQQKEAKEFLLGLRKDLLADINEIREDKESYLNQKKAYNYVTSIKHKQTLNIDSLKKYQKWLFIITRMQENNGRFEGFKTSGKIGTLENKIIQNDIMNLYQENIPSLLASTDAYLRWKNQLYDFVTKNLKKITDSSTNISIILLSDEAQNLCFYLANQDEVINQYDICMNKMKTLVTEIENEYSITLK